MLEGALRLDEPTREHARHLFRIGQAHGRRADAFGLVDAATAPETPAATRSLTGPSSVW